jgi:hypothetical protein
MRGGPGATTAASAGGAAHKARAVVQRLREEMLVLEQKVRVAHALWVKAGRAVREGDAHCTYGDTRCEGASCCACGWAGED